MSLEKKRDAIKVQYCKDNNISLIAIPYWEFKNIDSILSKELGLESKPKQEHIPLIDLLDQSLIEW